MTKPCFVVDKFCSRWSREALTFAALQRQARLQMEQQTTATAGLQKA